MDKIRKHFHKYGYFLLCIILAFTVLPVSVKAETVKGSKTSQSDQPSKSKVVRVGWYEDSYHITDQNGDRSGYGYEYEQAVSAYTGWDYKYVKGSWDELFKKLQNGEIDLMSAISYSDERAKTMLFSDQPMGEEKYYLYADLANSDISASDLSTLNGKSIAMLENSVQTTQFCEWEKKYNVKTRHVFVDSIDQAKEMFAKHELQGVLSTETSIWVDAGLSSIVTTGGSNIYYGINKNRPDLKEKLDSAMRSMENDKPFYSDDLYKQYIATQSVAVLSSDEQKWLKQHDAIRVGYMKGDTGFSTVDAQSGEIVGVINDYMNFAKNCFEQPLNFELTGFDSLAEQIQALKENKIDMIFHVSQNPYYAEENGLSLSNTVLSVPIAAVTTQDAFNENAKNKVAISKENAKFKWYVSYNYPEWKIIECDSVKDAEKAVKKGNADCFIARSGQTLQYINEKDLHSVFLTKTANSSFGVKKGNTELLSILNKTLKAMQTSKLSGAVSMYEDSTRKVTVMDFVKDNLVTVSLSFISIFLVILCIILRLLNKARRAEIQAKEAQSQAEMANAAKSSFLFNMSHDIRTPMNAILGFTELAQKNSDNAHLIKEYLGKIKASGQGLLSILDNVLELARIESGKTTLEESPQKASDVFDACMVMMNPEIEKRHHTVTVVKEIQYPYVYFDASRVTEIILNLLSNAIKYTSDGGSIHCHLKQTPHPQEGWVYQELSVEDNGIGMSDEFQQHIFENFARERSTTISGIQGTGLGMGIVKKLVDLMGGVIEIKSKLGEGSVVMFRVPLRIASLEDTKPKRSEELIDKELLRGKKILLAEDNDLNAEIAITLLEEEGLKAERVTDGVQCVEKIEKYPEKYFALILMDIQMPNMDGYRATEKIRKLNEPEKANIPIIAMTANAFTEDRIKAINAGMNDHVSKPIDMNILVMTMLKYL